MIIELHLVKADELIINFNEKEYIYFFASELYDRKMSLRLPVEFFVRTSEN